MNYKSDWKGNKPPTDGLNRLFVYGIFLSEANRKRYGMSNPRYATVKDWITCGDHIVVAHKVDKKLDASLTGLLVDVDPKHWKMIDALEAGYDRVKVNTWGEEVWMYGRAQ